MHPKVDITYRPYCMKALDRVPQLEAIIRSSYEALGEDLDARQINTREIAQSLHTEAQKYIDQTEFKIYLIPLEYWQTETFMGFNTVADNDSYCLIFRNKQPFHPKPIFLVILK